jgi:hypothetical protein
MKPKIILGLALVLSGWFGCCLTGFAGAERSPPVSVPFPGPGPDLPGVSKGKIESYWLAPYVRASEGFGGGTITWFTEDWHIRRRTAVSGIEPGFVDIIGQLETIQGINEDWKITLPAEPTAGQSVYNMSGYITSTMDSRVFVHEFHPKPGWIALDI